MQMGSRAFAFLSVAGILATVAGCIRYASGSPVAQVLRSARFSFLLKLQTVLLVTILACACGSSCAQTNEWVWVGGSNTPPANGKGIPGVYGTLGAPAAGNTPGSRDGSVSWTDASGNLWLFGGYGTDSTGTSGDLNDLWKYDPSKNEWTWISGTNQMPVNQSGSVGQPGVYGTLGAPAAGNVPGGRSSAGSWIDSSGNLWLFGGGGIDQAGMEGDLNDLWEFNPATSQWTWMAGSGSIGSDCNFGHPYEPCQPGIYGTEGVAAKGNTPGSRYSSVAWTDNSGNLWLFGGSGSDSVGKGGLLNDLWKFDVSAKAWAWMGGSNKVSNCGLEQCDQSGLPGVYGTLGTPAAANIPGGRDSSVSWTDASGNFWLFGGFGLDALGAFGRLDDLWEFNVATGQWTWMSGSSTIVTTSIYGTLGVAASANIPPGRDQAIGWADSAGNFWMFGGNGADATGDFGVFDDMWMINSSNREWAWMGGPIAFSYCTVAPFGGGNTWTGCGQSAVFGTLGAPSAGNNPGSRLGAASWVDSSGDFWLFGGTDPQENLGVNDLWKYVPSTRSLPPAVTPAFSPSSGTYPPGTTTTISNGMANAVIYFTTDGTTPTTNSTLYKGPITVSSSMTIEAIATAAGYPTSGVGSVSYLILPQAATPVFSVPAGTYTSAQTLTISDSTPGATIYYTNDSPIPTTSSTAYSGPITVSGSETITAIAVANGYSPSAIASAAYTLPWTFQLTTSPSSLTLQSGTQGTLTLSVTPENGFNSTVSFACSGLPAGAACSFSPANVTPPGSTTTTLTVSAPAHSAVLHKDVRSILPGGVLALAFCAFGWKRRRAQSIALLVLFCAAVGLISACGSKTPQQQPTTYLVTVTASAGAVSQTAKFTLTLN